MSDVLSALYLIILMTYYLGTRVAEAKRLKAEGEAKSGKETAEC